MRKETLLFLLYRCCLCSCSIYWSCSRTESLVKPSRSSLEKEVL